MVNFVIVSQVCSVERKEHAAHIGAGSKKAKGSDAKSGKIKEGLYDTQVTLSPCTVEIVNYIWFVLGVLWAFGLK